MVTRRAFVGGLAASALAPTLPLAGGLGGAAWAADHTALLDRAKAALDRHASKITLRDRIAIADFGKHSSLPRFHLIDMASGAVRTFRCAHGKGSDMGHTGWLMNFSNTHGSLATSAGAYQTGNLYQGKYGRSIRLWGLEDTNSNALDRAIVMHEADYVSDSHVSAWGKLGRSDGCFVLPPAALDQVLGLLGPWRLLYADRAGVFLNGSKATY